MNTLKIEIPKGHEVESFDKTTGVIKFKETPKDIKERIKTFDDVLKHHKITLTEWSHRITTLSTDEVAYIQIKLIAEVLNEGWTPDWTDGTPKYYPWFKMGSASGVGFSYYDHCDDWHSASGVGSRLCFKSRELAEYAGKQFEAIYKEFLTLNQ